MALRNGVSVGVQTALRATSPTPSASQHVKQLVRAVADTTQRVQLQQESIQQCWHKLSTTEQLAADMVDKIMTTSRRMEQLNDKLNGTKAAAAKKRKLCAELRQVIDYGSSKLGKSGMASKWAEFQTSEMDKKIANNARWIEEYNKERVKYQNQLRSILTEVNSLKHQLEDADESVRYIENFRDKMEEEHEEEILSLRMAIKEAYVTRNTMMSAKPDAMTCVVRQLLPDDEDYEQLVAETEDLNMKCIMLKKRLNEQSKEMLQYHSKNHELSLRIKELTAKVNEARAQRAQEPSDMNAHAQIWNKHPLTWFRAPNVSMEEVKDFLISTYGKDAEARVIKYLALKAEGESRWHSQMFEKDFVEYDRTMEILAEHYSGLRWEQAGKAGISDSQKKDDALPLAVNKTPVPLLKLDNVLLSESELELCEAAATGIKPIIVDNIGNIEKQTVGKPTKRLSFKQRLQAIFKR